MKTLTIFAWLLSLTFAAPTHAKGPGSGQGGGAANGQSARPLAGMHSGNAGIDSTSRSPLAHDLQFGVQALDQFLKMDDAALAEMEAVIRRIRQMSPAERDALQAKVSAYITKSAEERAEIGRAWGHLDNALRAEWRTYMLGLDEAQRQTVRRELQAVPVEKRAQWRIDRLKAAKSKADSD